MMDHAVADYQDVDPERQTRRQWWSTLGLAVVTGIVALTGEDTVASADPYCCYLANPNGPFCNYSGTPANFNCSKYGGTKHKWMCCFYGSYLGCGECNPGPTCEEGPFYCSISWNAGPGPC
jgi:hypothetical protein